MKPLAKSLTAASLLIAAVPNMAAAAVTSTATA
jgi:hypothetical protein